MVGAVCIPGVKLVSVSNDSVWQKMEAYWINDDGPAKTGIMTPCMCI